MAVGLCLTYQNIFFRPRSQPSAPPLPQLVAQTFIPTPSGPLEVLYHSPASSLDAGPNGENTHNPLFFIHGGMGGAWVWLEYLQYFSSIGIPCYAISLRGHGDSWQPSYLRMVWGTTKGMLADDAVAGIKWVEEKEGRKVVLVGHSSGGGLGQLILNRGGVRVKGLALLGAVPGFGS